MSSDKQLDQHQMIQALKDARDKKGLVIFVGAGISMNSGLPSWGSLIKNFAQELPMDNCKACPYVSDWHIAGCPIEHSGNKDVSGHLPNSKEECSYRYAFQQDDYLKIPQFCFDKNQNSYIRICKESFPPCKPNELHEIIFSLFPKHIITTNYDNLLECSKHPNVIYYSTISKDSDFLRKQKSDHYIVKMHGDINDSPTEWVLKENDYLTYSTTHILTEAFIKALLIDHTFLFLGYSINDYNLKIILSWTTH